MKTTLLEQYKDRLAIAESLYSRSHNGAKLSNMKKIATAQCLKNISSFMNESFDAPSGTQRSDMGFFKKFALNLANCAIPNLIAFDLVIVHPMSSMSGYVNYMEYTIGTSKGGDAQGDLINSPFALGDVSSEYTSSKVTEEKTLGESTTTFKISWAPVVKGTVKITNGSDKYVDDGNGKIYKNPTSVSYRTVTDTNNNGVLSGTSARLEVTLTGGSEAGSVIYDGETAGITLTSGITGETTISYTYNNVVIPQNTLPTVKAQMKAIPLVAQARRISVYYSQIAAFQAKADYGMDLGEQLAEQAIGELQYEIDKEVIDLLKHTADTNGIPARTWSKTQVIGVSLAEHYQSFLNTLELIRADIYSATKKFAPNYMVIAADVLPVLTFINGFVAAPVGPVNGPYYAGQLNGLKVYVTPTFNSGEFVVGVNGSDMVSSVAVFAPYMAIVPTQLLQGPDGATTQGWSSLYALEVLNKNLIVKGNIVD